MQATFSYNIYKQEILEGLYLLLGIAEDYKLRERRPTTLSILRNLFDNEVTRENKICTAPQ